MFDDKVVVLHSLDISHDVSVDVMWFFVVLQVFVVCEYRGYMRRAK